MKRIHIFFFLCCFGITGYGQNEDFLKVYEGTIKEIAKQGSLFTFKKDSLFNSRLTEYWDTSQYNPYKRKINIFPFNIVFEDSTYASPINGKKVITSRYGWRNRRAHKGIDIDLVTGDDVMAMFDGKVRYVKYTAGHGKMVVIRHFNGVETVYAHLSKQLVKANDTVTKGQIIGKGGNTGNSRGSHLHLEVSFEGIYIHPEYLFDFGKENKIRSQNIWVTKDWTTPYIHSSRRQSQISISKTYHEAIESSKKQRKIYVVKRGDTLSRISNTNHVSIAAICKTNKIRKTSTLKIGQKLVLIQ